VKSLKLAAVAAIATFVMAACGSTTATPGGASTPTASPSSAVGASAPATSAAATSAAPASTTATAAATVGAPVDLCSLLSPADLDAATGKKYEAGFLDSSGACSWNVGLFPGNNGNLIIASIQDQPLSLIKSTFEGGVDVTVSGHAGYWNGGQGLASMWVDIGGRVFILSFPRSVTLGPADQAIAQALAEIAVGKM
jgi:hypothetical protein